MLDDYNDNSFTVYNLLGADAVYHLHANISQETSEPLIQISKVSYTLSGVLLFNSTLHYFFYVSSHFSMQKIRSLLVLIY